MTLDEAIQRHKEAANGDCCGCAYMHCSDCYREHEQLAEWLDDYKKLKEATRWIPCSERLPEDYISVLLYGNRIGIVKGFFTSYKDYYIADSGNTAVRKNAVTHWMPLPDPPKGE